MSIKSELLAIQLANQDRMLHCNEVVAWAKKNTRSELHAALDWDDKSAAHKFRLSQVRQLITLHIVSADRAPQMVSLTIDRKDGGGYRSISDVLAMPSLREIMLEDALLELERMKARFARVQELATVWDAAQEVRVKTPRRKKAG